MSARRRNSPKVDSKPSPAGAANRTDRIPEPRANPEWRKRLAPVQNLADMFMNTFNPINRRWFHCANRGQPMEITHAALVKNLNALKRAPAAFFHGLTKILAEDPALTDKWQPMFDWLFETMPLETNGPITPEVIDLIADSLERHFTNAANSTDPAEKWAIANHVAGIANGFAAATFKEAQTRSDVERSKTTLVDKTVTAAPSQILGETADRADRESTPATDELSPNDAIVDDDSYISAKGCRYADIDTHAKLRGVIKREKLRTRHKGSQRLFVHAGDWHRFVAMRENAKPNLTDESLQGVFDDAANRLETIRARKAKKGPPSSDPTYRLLIDGA